MLIQRWIHELQLLCSVIMHSIAAYIYCRFMLVKFCRQCSNSVRFQTAWKLIKIIHLFKNISNQFLSFKYCNIFSSILFLMSFYISDAVNILSYLKNLDFSRKYWKIINSGIQHLLFLFHQLIFVDDENCHINHRKICHWLYDLET